MKIEKIVITGGPCAGKTTAMNKIKIVFTERGYHVAFVPESATELINAGITPATLNSKYEFQRCLLKLQLKKEKAYVDAAKKIFKSDKTLVVFDRGTLDNKAYLKPWEFEKILDEVGVEEEELMSEYGAVFHLETAAKGAETFYSLGNNSARTETREEAIEIDNNLISVWADHPYFRVIDNSSDFDGKMEKLISEITEFLGE